MKSVFALQIPRLTLILYYMLVGSKRFLTLSTLPDFHQSKWSKKQEKSENTQEKV